MKLKENIGGKQVISCLVVFVLASVLGINVYAYENRFETKQEVVTLEYGEDLSKDCAEYIDANEETLKKTVLDMSNLDNMKEGTYEVTASFGDKKVSFQVEVKDTVKPEVTLLSNGKYTCVAGNVLTAVQVVSKMDDKAGIQSVAFAESQTVIESESDNLLDAVGLKYDKAGTYENKVSVTDTNGNKQEKVITVEVVEDYLAHVSGFKDITVEQGASVDWMDGITKDDKIAKIEVDASAVDLNTAGSYEVTYKIHGDDGKTVVDKKVKVTVTTPVVTYNPQNNSSSCGRSSSGGRGSSSSGGYGGSSGGSGGSSGNSSGGGSGSGHKAGDTFTGTQEGGKHYIGGGSEESGSNWSEGGSFDW